MSICETCPLRRHNGTRPLTPRQAEIFRFIADAIARTGVAPSQEEIRIAIGVRSAATVAEHIDTLEAKGYVTSEFNRSHSLRLTPAALAWLETFTPTEAKP
jgi:repressor LexA